MDCKRARMEYSMPQTNFAITLIANDGSRFDVSPGQQSILECSEVVKTRCKAAAVEDQMPGTGDTTSEEEEEDDSIQILVNNTRETVETALEFCRLHHTNPLLDMKELINKDSKWEDVVPEGMRKLVEGPIPPLEKLMQVAKELGIAPLVKLISRRYAFDIVTMGTQEFKEAYGIQQEYSEELREKVLENNPFLKQFDLSVLDTHTTTTTTTITTTTTATETTA